MVEVGHSLEIIEDLDFEFQIPCDHETCDLNAEYLIFLFCPSCYYEEEFFICDPHWTKILPVAKTWKVKCNQCVFSDTFDTFLVDCQPLH
jgi:hypothetical protein